MASNPVRAELQRKVNENGGITRLLERIAAGETITNIAKEYGVSRPTLSLLLTRKAGTDKVAAARKEAAAALADQCLNIADACNHDNDRAAKQQIGVRQWLAGRMDPEAWGDKQGPLVNVNVEQLHLDALRRAQTECNPQLTAGE